VNPRIKETMDFCRRMGYKPKFSGRWGDKVTEEKVEQTVEKKDGSTTTTTATNTTVETKDGDKVTEEKVEEKVEKKDGTTTTTTATTTANNHS
jgi:hypothetical protein